MIHNKKIKTIHFLVLYLVISHFFLGAAYSEVASIIIDCESEIGTVSPLLFGNNIEWAGNGIDIWDPLTNDFRPRFEELVKDLGVQIIRFPGGTLSDKYFWYYGIGPQNSRGNNLDWSNNNRKSLFGTDEFSILLDRIGTEGIISVNFGTGTAVDAANWVEYCNGSSTNTDWGRYVQTMDLLSRLILSIGRLGMSYMVIGNLAIAMLIAMP